MHGTHRRSRFAPAAAACLALLPVLTGGCGSDITGPGKPITDLPRPLTSAERDVIQSSNSFAVNLLGQVYRASPDSTVFLSPLSASMALGMTMNGAGGATRDQMREMLGFGALPMADVDASYRGLLDLLVGLDPRVDLEVANAIFHENSWVLRPAFTDTVQQYFDAEVAGLDFASPSAVSTINAWVKKATKGHIDSIVSSPLDPLLRAVLLNAVYFKGDWSRKFDSGKTRPADFHLSGGGTATVRLMEKQDTLPYLASDRWQAVEIPYGGGAFEMTVAVPRDGATLDDVVADLGDIVTPRADWPKTHVALYLPRFQLSWQRTLNDDLKALGMVDAFDRGAADLSPMVLQSDGRPYVQWVKQKTFLKVDEEGTTAAAVTGVGVGVTAVPLFKVVKADRPFLLAIRERLTGTVLFAGLIVQPPTE